MIVEILTCSCCRHPFVALPEDEIAIIDELADGTERAGRDWFCTKCQKVVVETNEPQPSVSEDSN